jgi:cyclopropane fatty-acyl-phospholipid synthase-like methyltransferase
VSRTEAIYTAIEQSPFTAWVNGLDPRIIASQNFEAIVANFDLPVASRVLDFGCGIGMTAVPLVEHLTAGEVIGVDIVPAAIAFCTRHIRSVFPNCSFYTTDGENKFYETIASAQADAPLMEEKLFSKKYHEYFDLAVAFSVFTHFDPRMAQKYLRMLREVLRDHGRAVLTWFFDHSANPEGTNLLAGEEFIDRCPDIALFQAVFSPSLFLKLASGAGFGVERICYGYWRDPFVSQGLKGAHYQDVTILRAL